MSTSHPSCCRLNMLKKFSHSEGGIASVGIGHSSLGTHRGKPSGRCPFGPHRALGCETSGPQQVVTAQLDYLQPKTRRAFWSFGASTFANTALTRLLGLRTHSYSVEPSGLLESLVEEQLQDQMPYLL